MKDKPKIVCLCGSTRFGPLFDYANMHETLMGRIVVSIGMQGHIDYPIGSRFLCSDGDEKAQSKQRLDQLHFAKIDLADEILVINPGGYLGKSTLKEIQYAAQKGKIIRYMFSTDLSDIFVQEVGEFAA